MPDSNVRPDISDNQPTTTEEGASSPPEKESPSSADSAHAQSEPKFEPVPLSQIVIDQTLQELFPVLPPGEHARFQSSLTEHGQLEPVTVSRKTRRLLDGHERYRAIKDLGWSTIWVRWVDAEDEDAELRLAIEANIRRKQLSPWQRGVVALRYEKAASERARARQLSGLRVGSETRPGAQPAEREKGRALDKVGTLFGVSGRQLHRIRALLPVVTDIDRGKLESGELTIRQATESYGFTDAERIPTQARGKSWEAQLSPDDLKAWKKWQASGEQVSAEDLKKAEPHVEEMRPWVEWLRASEKIDLTFFEIRCTRLGLSRTQRKSLDLNEEAQKELAFWLARLSQFDAARFDAYFKVGRETQVPGDGPDWQLVKSRRSLLEWIPEFETLRDRCEPLARAKKDALVEWIVAAA